MMEHFKLNHRINLSLFSPLFLLLSPHFFIQRWFWFIAVTACEHKLMWYTYLIHNPLNITKSNEHDFSSVNPNRGTCRCTMYVWGSAVSNHLLLEQIFFSLLWLWSTVKKCYWSLFDSVVVVAAVLVIERVEIVERVRETKRAHNNNR